MTQIDEEARHAAKMAFADAMTKQRIGIGSLDRDDLALVAEKTDAMLESALSAYLTALADKGYVIVPSEPTEGMIEAGLSAPEPTYGQLVGVQLRNVQMANAYRAMLAARDAK
ncbi:MAG: hypothetical protein EP341_02990 [Sphingomonadales bacterium]|nr:MAG: hypothetical protein EP341_02990 [Sphingomonadales bacterium]